MELRTKIYGNPLGLSKRRNRRNLGFKMSSPYEFCKQRKNFDFRTRIYYYVFTSARWIAQAASHRCLPASIISLQNWSTCFDMPQTMFSSTALPLQLWLQTIRIDSSLT